MVPGDQYANRCEKSKVGALLKSPWAQRISKYRHETQLLYYGFKSMDFFKYEIEPIDVRRHHKINDIDESKISTFFHTNISCALQEHPFRYVQERDYH